MIKFEYILCEVIFIIFHEIYSKTLKYWDKIMNCILRWILFEANKCKQGQELYIFEFKYTLFRKCLYVKKTIMLSRKSEYKCIDLNEFLIKSENNSSCSCSYSYMLVKIWVEHYCIINHTGIHISGILYIYIYIERDI